MTAPSPGMISPAVTYTRSPRRSWLDGTCSVAPLGRIRFAVVSRRVRRRDSACALPRPSAIASAKLAKITVNHSHTEMANTKERSATLPTITPLRKTSVVTTAPTSTTNITGLRACVRGLSLVSEPISALRMISEVHGLTVRARFISVISSLCGACGDGAIAIAFSLNSRQSVAGSQGWQSGANSFPATPLYQLPTADSRLLPRTAFLRAGARLPRLAPVRARE